MGETIESTAYSAYDRTKQLADSETVQKAREYTSSTFNNVTSTAGSAFRSVSGQATATFETINSNPRIQQMRENTFSLLNDLENRAMGFIGRGHEENAEEEVKEEEKVEESLPKSHSDWYPLYINHF